MFNKKYKKINIVLITTFFLSLNSINVFALNNGDGGINLSKTGGSATLTANSKKNTSNSKNSGSGKNHRKGNSNGNKKSSSNSSSSNGYGNRPEDMTIPLNEPDLVNTYTGSRYVSNDIAVDFSWKIKETGAYWDHSTLLDNFKTKTKQIDFVAAHDGYYVVECVPRRKKIFKKTEHRIYKQDYYLDECEISELSENDRNNLKFQDTGDGVVGISTKYIDKTRTLDAGSEYYTTPTQTWKLYLKEGQRFMENMKITKQQIEIPHFLVK